jgi:hypothetical protein
MAINFPIGGRIRRCVRPAQEKNGSAQDEKRDRTTAAPCNPELTCENR